MRPQSSSEYHSRRSCSFAASPARTPSCDFSSLPSDRQAAETSAGVAAPSQTSDQGPGRVRSLRVAASRERWKAVRRQEIAMPWNLGVEGRGGKGVSVVRERWKAVCRQEIAKP